MTPTTELQTTTLNGPALAWAVGRAEGMEMFIISGQYQNGPGVFALLAGRAVRWQPEVDANQAWPLMLKHGHRIRLHLDFQCNAASYLEAGIRCGFTANEMLTAVLRTLVSYKFGRFVAIPTELIEPDQGGAA